MSRISAAIAFGLCLTGNALKQVTEGQYQKVAVAGELESGMVLRGSTTHGRLKNYRHSLMNESRTSETDALHETDESVSLNTTDTHTFSQLRSAAYAEAYAIAGLSKQAAWQMGVEWKAAGLPSKQIIGGIDTECDGNQFDRLETIDAKAKYACKMGLGGMMNWRLDNDYFELDGKCQFGWPKKEGSGQTFKGAYKLRDSIKEHCKDKADGEKPLLAGYVGFGINYDMFGDKWNARKGTPLYKAIPFDAVDRIYLAFADIKGCEFQKLNDDVDKVIKEARKKNTDIEIFLTSPTPASKYQDDNGGYCSMKKDAPFVSSLLQTMQDHDLNGYDVDWEDSIDKSAFMDLLENVGKAFETSKYSLAMAVWPTFSESQYDLDKMRKHVKHVSLMSYGGSGASLQHSAESFMRK